MLLPLRARQRRQPAVLRLRAAAAAGLRRRRVCVGGGSVGGELSTEALELRLEELAADSRE